MTPNAAVVGMQSRGLKFLFPQAGCVCSCARCNCLTDSSVLLSQCTCPGPCWHPAARPSLARCYTTSVVMPGSVTLGVTCMAQGVQEMLNQVELSVRKNEQNLPSVWGELKKQCWRPVICLLLWVLGSKYCGENLAQSFEDQVIDVSPGLHRT